MDSVGKTLVYIYGAATFLPILIASCFWWGLDSNAKLWSGFLVFILTYGAGMVGVVFLAKRELPTTKHAVDRCKKLRGRELNPGLPRDRRKY